MEENSVVIREEKKLEAFILRFQGCTHKQISEMLLKENGSPRWADTTLESKFSKNGAWYDEYTAWVKFRTDDINEQVSKMFVSNATQALQVLISIMNSEVVKPEVRSANAKDLLDRAGFQVVQKIEHRDTSDDIAESMAKELEDYKRNGGTIVPKKTKAAVKA